MDTFLTIVMGLISSIEELLPSIGLSTSVSNTIVKLLGIAMTIIPLVEQNAGNVIQAIKNIITSVTSSGSLTADQMAQMDAFNAQVDAAWAAADAAADKADAAAEPPAA
jgi:hypothetical protein